MDLETIFTKALEIGERVSIKWQIEYEKMKEKYDEAYESAREKVVSMSDNQLLSAYEKTKSLPVRKAIREELDERGIDYKTE